MDRLSELYGINDQNLGLRKDFIRLRPADVRVLRSLAGWADGAADDIAREFYDHQFAFAGTVEFFQAYATANGRSMQDLRAALQRSQAGYLRRIFQEAAAGGQFGATYFEERLHVGKLHNTIDLPLK